MGGQVCLSAGVMGGATPWQRWGPGAVAVRRLQAQFVEAEEGQEAAVEVMRDVVGRAADLMASNYLDRLAVPYTVQVAGGIRF